jgi:DNA-binding transcriptional MerR regulator
MMQDRHPAPARKAEGAFKTISEVAEELDLPAHVLRFWETKFSQIQPLKRSGGRRYYRPADIETIARIRELLHHQGYTIRGVQQLFKSEERSSPRQPHAAVTGTLSPASAALTVVAGQPSRMLSGEHSALAPVTIPANDANSVVIAREDLQNLRAELAQLAEALRQTQAALRGEVEG